MLKYISYFLLAISSVLFLQCGGVKYSLSGASIPPEAKTVSVQYMPNNAPIVNPNLSQELTDAIKDKFQSQTSLKLINGVGDLDFEGEITGYDVKPVAIQGGDVAAKNRLTITVRMRYANPIDPKYDFDKKFSRYEDYDSSSDLKDVEDEITEKIIEQLVEDVFNQSVVNW